MGVGVLPLWILQPLNMSMISLMEFLNLWKNMYFQSSNGIFREELLQK